MPVLRTEIIEETSWGRHLRRVDILWILKVRQKVQGSAHSKH